MTTSLVLFGLLGIATTVAAFVWNRRLFGPDGAGRVTVLEGTYYLVGVVSLILGWYFDVRYTHHAGSRATYIDFTKALFPNWAADSAAQDYIAVNVVLFPLWSIVDGRRRGLRVPWMFFVMSLFTSLAFSVAVFLALMERQIRFRGAAVEPAVEPVRSPTGP